MANDQEQAAQTQKKQASEQAEQKEALVCLDKTNNQFGVVTNMDQETGTIEWEGPNKGYQDRMQIFPSNTLLGKFFDAFCKEYGNPSQIGFSFFRVPVDMVGKVFDAIVKMRLVEETDTKAIKLLQQYELNDEGRIAKLAGKYKFEERELPLSELAEWGVTPEIMRDHKCMGDFMKGRITDTPLPIRKLVNGQWKEMGEACFCATRVEGQTHLMVLPVLKKEQFNTAPFDQLFNEDEKNRLATEGHLGTTKVMKDFATGRECECYVSYHAPTKRLTTLPVDSIQIPHHIYGQSVHSDDWKTLKNGGKIEVTDIQRRNGQVISGTARVDANRRDVFFSTGGNLTLKVGRVIHGAPITEEQARILENRGTVYVRNMRNSKTGAIFSDDVRYSDSNILLIGHAARQYKSRIGKENSPQTQYRKPRHKVASIPAPKSAPGRKPKRA